MIIEEPSKTYGKKDAYYFSHDSNARNDSKCLKLRRVLGLEGYGLFWVLVEMLREAKDYRLPLNSITDIAFEARVSEEKITALIGNFDLFEVEDDCFFSLRLTRSMDKMQQKSLKYANNAQKRWKNAIALPLHSDCNALKESKVNKRKGKDIKELGDTSQKHFVIITPKYANEHPYRLWGVDGVGEFLEMNGSKWPRTDLAEKFMRDKSGQPFNDFGHILNAYNLYIKNQFK
jgi:hypothetical protein